jgi:hypothetical protein
MQINVRILMEMHWKHRQSRIHKNGSTRPIWMKFGLVLTLPKCIQMASKTQNVEFGNELFNLKKMMNIN